MLSIDNETYITKDNADTVSTALRDCYFLTNAIIGLFMIVSYFNGRSTEIILS